MASLQELRDRRIASHAAAVAYQDRGLLFATNLESATLAGRTLANEFGDEYDQNLTLNYMREVTDSQLEAGTDGLGSATGAVMSGARLYVQMSTFLFVITWRHTTRGNARQSHIDADGQQVTSGENFDVAPGMGSPGCGCYVEVERVRT